MLLSTSLLPLPPPPTSLLPPLTSNTPTNQSSQPQHPHHHHAHHRRPRPAINPNATLPLLTTDERALTQRKLAIAMYGYSWLKPAGCPKTMLGMREEQLEREEVERQMREAELQERMAGEAEEMERRLEREAEGEEAGVEERDLDDEIPEHEVADGEEGWGTDGEVEEEGMGGDLDDDIPEAAELSEVLSDEEMTSEIAAQDSPVRNDWTYDTRREPDTEEEESGDEALRRIRRTARMAREARQQGYQRTPGAPGSDYDVDERDAEALALAEQLLDEDEMGDVSYGDDQDRDLDDSVPEAEEGEWEHTDSDGEDDFEEDMDISIMPSAAPQHRLRRSEGPQHYQPSSSARSARVISGNAALGSTNRSSPADSSSAPNTAASSQARRGLRSQAQLRNPSLTLPAQQSSSYATPSVGGQQGGGGRGLPRTSMLLATESSMGEAEGDSIMGGGGQAVDSSHANANANGNGGRRGWLNPASARRNLFGLSRGAGGVASNSNSSGGLFTPEAQPGQGQAAAGQFETPDMETPATGTGRQTRSGRLLAGLGRRGRRGEET